MNVMNRKLFANRDARRKLANMGGIMVSSPELMQAAQTFENGGRAVVKLKTVRIGDPLGGTNYDLYSDGSAVMLSTGRRIDLRTTPVLNPCLRCYKDCLMFLIHLTCLNHL